MTVSSPPEPTPTSLPDRREQLRDELEATRALYFELADLIGETKWNNPSGNPAWTVGQVMGHIILVFDKIPMKMERLRKGKGLPGLPKLLFDPLNNVATRLGTRSYNPGNIRSVYDDAHQKALATLDSIQEHEWKYAAHFFGVYQDTAELFHYHAKHVREHEPDVRAGI